MRPLETTSNGFFELEYQQDRKDGTGLVMIPEARFDFLQTLNTWAIARLRLERLIAEQQRASADDLGDLGWLRVFEIGDLRTFSQELREAMLASHADQDTAPLDTMIETWRATARRIARGGRKPNPQEPETGDGKFPTWGEAQAALASAPRPDDEFRSDLDEIRAMSRGERPRDPWEQS